MNFTDFAERFRAALRIKTDWPPGAKRGDKAAEAPLVTFQDFLAETYPAFHKRAERWALSPYAVVYRWPGAANANAANAVDTASITGANDGDATNDAAAPVLFLGHYDVVPAETAKWSADPFGAELKDGYIYGRGALDMKSIVAAIMESAEILCARGFTPKRDIWFAFGGDEERTGVLGAAETAAWLSARGIHFSFIIDEGTPVARNQIKGVDKPLALIGVEEKGYLSLELSVEQKPGHASQPPQEQAAALLARALLRVSRRPFPWRLTPTVEAFFRRLSPHTKGISSFVMKHARLLGPLFFKAAAQSPATRALLRTTTAITQLEGSAADNVLPSTVRAVINLRLLPPWTTETAATRVKAAVADNRVKVAVHGLATNPVQAAPEQAALKSPGWKEIKTSAENVFPGAPVLPFLMLATTDSRHYQPLSNYIFRFSPMVLTPEELARIHGHDERVSLENLEQCLQFYTSLMEQL